MRRPSRMLPLAFGCYGVMWGGWWALVPELVGHYGLTPGPLGAILTGGFLLSLPAMVLAGRLVDRLGAARSIAVPASLMAGGLLLVAVLPPLPLLVVAVGALAVGSGTFDVAINGTALGDERWSRPARLTLLHATFSGGGVVGAVAGGLVAGAEVPFHAAYVALAGLLLMVALLARRSRWPLRPSLPDLPPGLGARLVPIAAIALLALLAGGTLEAWSALYLRDDLGAGAFVGALGPAAYYLAMMIGRLLGAAAAGRLGASTTLLIGGGAAVLGMVVALGIALPAVAIPAMAAAALGTSFMLPVAVSLAAGRAPGHPGRAASYVLTVGYAGLIIGPSLIGGLAEVAGLRAALTVVPLAGLVVVLFSRTSIVRHSRG